MDKRPFEAYRGDEPYIFVSYAHADAQSVYPLLIALRERGVKIWYDEGIEPGSKWREELSNAIQNAEKVLYIASAKSVASPNCERELDFALSLSVPVRVVYIEQVDLPPALGFSLGSHQAVVSSHYDRETFEQKVYDAISLEPEKSLGKIVSRRAQGHRGIWALAISLALAPVLIFVAMQVGGNGEGDERAPIDITPTIEDPVRIAVNPLRNATGNDELDWVGDGLANLLRDRLSSSRYGVVLSPVSWRSISQSVDTQDELMARAKEAGIDYLISGDLVGSEDDLLATMRVTNLRAGIDVMSQTYPDLTTEELVNSSLRIALGAKQAMKIPREDGLQSLSADFVTDNIAAYEAYIDGLEHYNRFEYEEAEKDLETALTLSPDFHIARYRLADILSVTSRSNLALAAVSQIPVDDPAIDQREQLYIDAFRLVLNGESDRAIALYEKILEEFPYEIEAQQLLARAYFDSFQIEKGTEVLQALRQQEPENPHVLGALGYQLTSIGELEAAGEVLNDYRDRYPDVPNAWELNGSLKLRQGNLSAAEQDFRKALELDSAFTAAKIGLANALAMEGRLGEAAVGFTAIRDDEALPPRPRIDAAFNLAYVRRAQEKPAEIATALAPVEALILDEQVRAGLYWYVLAAGKMDQGDDETAADYLAKGQEAHPAAGVPTRFLHGRGVLDARRGNSIDDEIEQLTQFRLPDDNPDRTEDKAILHLRGLAALQNGDASKARAFMEEAVSLYGYEYGVYSIALAQAVFTDGDRRDALAMIEKARGVNESLLSGEVRLDLLWHRHRAAHLQAEFHEALGQEQKAQELLAAVHEAP